MTYAGYLWHSIGRFLDVNESQLRHWKGQAAAMATHLHGGRGCWVNRAARTLHRSQKSLFDHIEEELVHFIFENREQGISVTIRTVIT